MARKAKTQESDLPNAAALREARMFVLIAAGIPFKRIGEELGISGWGVYLFAARRGWLGEEALAKVEADAERRRMKRAQRDPDGTPLAKPRSSVDRVMAGSRQRIDAVFAAASRGDKAAQLAIRVPPEATRTPAEVGSFVATALGAQTQQLWLPLGDEAVDTLRQHKSALKDALLAFAPWVVCRGDDGDVDEAAYHAAWERAGAILEAVDVPMPGVPGE